MGLACVFRGAGNRVASGSQKKGKTAEKPAEKPAEKVEEESLVQKVENMAMELAEIKELLRGHMAMYEEDRDVERMIRNESLAAQLRLGRRLLRGEEE
jgi:hypothetical protein